MKTLPTALSYAGHQLRQIWRQANVAVYERSIPSKSAYELELIVIEEHPEAVLPSGARIPAQEGYPSSSKWGKLGWSFPVRHTDMVLDLAEKLTAISKNRGVYVRDSITNFRRLRLSG